MANEPAGKTLQDQADDLDRIIKEAQRLREDVKTHLDTLRGVRSDTMVPKERRKTPR